MALNQVTCLLTADRWLNKVMIGHIKQRNDNTKMDSCVYSYFLLVNYKYLLLHTGMKFLTLRFYPRNCINLYTEQLQYCLQLPVTPCRCAEQHGADWKQWAYDLTTEFHLHIWTDFSAQNQHNLHLHSIPGKSHACLLVVDHAWYEY